MSPLEAGAGGASRGLTARLSATAGVQAFGVGAGSLISFFTFAALARDLGPGTFGSFAAATAYLAIPTLLADSGMSIAVLREIARTPDATEHAIRASLPVRALVALVVLACAVALAYVVPFNDEIRLAVLIGSVTSFVTLVGGGVVPVLQERLRMGWAVLAGVAGRAATLACAVTSIALGYGLSGAALSYVAGAVVTSAVQVWAVSRLIPVRPMSDRTYARRLLGESSLLGAATSVGLVLWRADSVLLAALRASREVGLYATAYRLVDLVGAFMSVIVNSVFPSLARFINDRDPRLRGLVAKTADLLIAGSVPCALLGAFFAPEAMVLVGGEEFRDGAVALRILSAVAVAAAVSALLERGLLAAGRERFLLAVNGGALALNLALNAVLIPLYGFRAAAATTLACEIAWIVVAAAGFRSSLGFLPLPRAWAAIGAATAVMVAALALDPLPVVLSAAVALLAYAAVLCALPGAPNDLLRLFLGGLDGPRRQAGWGRQGR